MRLSLLFLLLPVLGYAQADILQSEVRFDVGNLWLNTVRGSFDEVKGDLFFSKKDAEASYFDLFVEAKSVSTGNGKRDEHLLTEDFFQAEAYPHISIKSERIFKKDGSEFGLEGVLTIKGISKPLNCTFSVKNEQEQSITLYSTFSVNREDFKLGESYGGFIIADEIKIYVEFTVSSLADTNSE